MIHTNNTLFVLIPPAHEVDALEDMLNTRKDNFIRSRCREVLKEGECFTISSNSGVGYQYIKATLLELMEAYSGKGIIEIDSNNALMYEHTLDGTSTCLGKFRLAMDEPSGNYIEVNGAFITLLDS